MPTSTLRSYSVICYKTIFILVCVHFELEELCARMNHDEFLVRN